MTSKITLDIDEALLQKAERWAQQQKLSLSDVISNFLRQLPEPDSILQDEHPLAKFAGILSDSEARELQQAIAAEFEQIETNEW
jgi:metal-responsive CopG/Arc/MetJ family transcriptional regulator